MPGLGGKFTIATHNAWIRERGERVIHETVLVCPCVGLSEVNDLPITDSPTLNCSKCLGFGYFHRKPQSLTGLVTAVNQDRISSDYSIKLYPGDCIFSPTVDAPIISQYDKITFTKPQPLTEGQIIVRGEGTTGFNAIQRFGLEENEDRLWYEAESVIHVEALDSDREYKLGSDFEVDGKVIRWSEGAILKNTRYVIKYNGYLEWIVLEPPMERRDRGNKLGQRVALRKVHVFRSTSADASEESATKRLRIGGVSTS